MNKDDIIALINRLEPMMRDAGDGVLELVVFLAVLPLLETAVIIGAIVVAVRLVTNAVARAAIARTTLETVAVEIGYGNLEFGYYAEENCKTLVRKAKQVVAENRENAEEVRKLRKEKFSGNRSTSHGR